jgi:putative salt-induced outer membrane protein
MCIRKAVVPGQERLSKSLDNLPGQQKTNEKALTRERKGMIQKSSLVNLAKWIGAGLSVVSTAVMAQEDAAAPAKPLSAEAEVGVVITNGNTETKQLSGKGKVVYEIDKWRHTGKLEALNTSDHDVTTAERYFASAKSDYKFSELEYLFVSVAYEDDRFAGYDYQTTESVGYGRRVISRPTLTLDVEAGPGARQNKFRDGSSENEFIVRANGDLVWKISEQATFNEVLTVEAGEDATISKSETSLKAKVNGNLAMKAAFVVSHSSKVPVGTSKTDTETLLTLVFSY